MKKNASPNIYDVARASDVSPSTVSRVLNGFHYVSNEKRARIRRAIASLGYRPSVSARNLPQGGWHHIGVFFPHTSPEYKALFLPALQTGICEEAVRLNVYLSIHTMAEGDDEFVAGMLQREHLDGIVWLDMPMSEKLRQTIDGMNMSLVVLNRKDSIVPTSIWINNQSGAKLATEHLISRGHRRIVHLAGISDVQAARDRMKGYSRAMKDAGLKEDIRATTFQRQEAETITRDILQGSAKPTAIFAASDWMAVGCIRAVQQMGLRVPEDVAVVGCDDSILASDGGIPLTSIHQPLEEMGQRAIRALVNHFRREKSDYGRDIRLEPTLVVRESTGGAE